LFEIALSKLIAYHTNVWHYSDLKTFPEPFFVDLNKFKLLYEESYNNLEFLKKIDFAHCTVDYDNMVNNHINLLDLGINIIPKTDKVLLKKNIEKFKIVKNYEEVYSYYKTLI